MNVDLAHQVMDGFELVELMLESNTPAPEGPRQVAKTVNLSQIDAGRRWSTSRWHALPSNLSERSAVTIQHDLKPSEFLPADHGHAHDLGSRSNNGQGPWIR
jgi:hypothetical protein